MKHLRIFVPILGLIALLALFFKLPEVSKLFGCWMCLSANPYAPLIGSGYFGFVIALSLLFPGFPHRTLARGGFVWALLLALVLSYLNLPTWCAACLVAHACNIFIWGIWLLSPSQHLSLAGGGKWCLTFVSAISVIALFSSLNLTFLAYGSRKHLNLAEISLQVGDAIPVFTAQTTEGLDVAYLDGELALNFIEPNCPYCLEQLQILKELPNRPYRLIHITPAVLSDEDGAGEWVLDPDNQLRKLFKVYGTPTLYIIGMDGKVSRVIHGVPANLKDLLR